MQDTTSIEKKLLETTVTVPWCMDWMAFKQKKRVRKAKNKYLKPGALAQIRYNRAATKSCTDIGKKRVVLHSKAAKIGLLRQTQFDIDITPVTSPDRNTFGTAMRLADGNRSYKSPVTPKTPMATECDSMSRLESLPMDLLVCLVSRTFSRLFHGPLLLS